MDQHGARSPSVYQTHTQTNSYSNQRLLNLDGARKGADSTAISIQPSVNCLQRQTDRDKTCRIWPAARPKTASEYQRAHTHCPHLTLSLVLALATFSQEKKNGVCHV